MRLCQYNAKLLYSRLNLDFDEFGVFLFMYHSYVLGLGWWGSLGRVRDSMGMVVIAYTVFDRKSALGA